jgi:hypothetical protein
MLFKGTSLSLILMPIIAVLVASVLFLRWRIHKRGLNPIDRAFKTFQMMGIAFGVYIATLWFALPMTPVLSTFGRPWELNSLDEVLKYLQEYNDAIVRTTEVVHAFLFLFLFWFLLGILEFFKVIRGELSVQTEARVLASSRYGPPQNPEMSGSH